MKKKVDTPDRARIVQVNHVGDPPKRRRIYRELDECLVRLKDHLTPGRKTSMQYLDAVGYLIKLNLNCVNIDLCELCEVL